MRVDRILMVIEHLKSIPEDVANAHVDMGDWGPKSSPSLGVKQLLQCGTVACAAGWMARIPQVTKDGFCIKEGYPGCYSRPFYRGLLHYEAIVAYLGIDESEARYIFSYGSVNGAAALRLVCHKLEAIIERD